MSELNFTSSPTVGRISEIANDLDSSVGGSTFETPDKRRRIVTFKETPSAIANFSESNFNEKHEENICLSDKPLDIKHSPNGISKSEMLRRNFRSTLEGLVEKVTKFVSEVEKVEFQERMIVMKQMKQKIENVRDNLVEEKRQFNDCIEKLRSTLG